MNMPREGKEETTMWNKGTVKVNGNSYTYTAKVFDEDSDFGIDCGRVSILSIRNAEEKEVISYYRGWDIMPKGEEITKVYDEVMSIITK
jgi:hypothetical protein